MKMRNNVSYCECNCFNIISDKRKLDSLEYFWLTYMPNKIQDLTKEIEELKAKIVQLEKSEDKYRKLFTTANDAIFILRGDEFVDCNDKTLEMFRCKRDEIIGHPPYEFSPPNQPNGKDSYSEAMKKINAALNGTPQFFEWIHKPWPG